MCVLQIGNACYFNSLYFQLKVPVFVKCRFVRFHLAQTVYVFINFAYRLSAEYETIKWQPLESGLQHWGVPSRLGRGLVRSCWLFKSPLVHAPLSSPSDVRVCSHVPRTQKCFEGFVNLFYAIHEMYLKTSPILFLIYLVLQNVRKRKYISSHINSSG